MKKVIAVVGPTGIGKTDLGLALALKFNGEIISGDSIQVYRKLDIGSGKATAAERRQVIHHLIDIFEIHENYNVRMFQAQCRKWIDRIDAEGKLPLIVGGTGLYIKAAIYDYLFLEEEGNAFDFEAYSEFSNEELLAMLNDRDPEIAQTIHVNNRKRLLRALAMAESGTRRSDVLKQQEHKPIYDAFVIGLTMDRAELYRRIEERVDRMIAAGLEKEVEALYREDCNVFRLQAMQGIGYREWKDYFIKGRPLETVVEEIKKHTRQFAKRQYTWFNNQMDVHWYPMNDTDCLGRIERDLKEWLKINE